MRICVIGAGALGGSYGGRLVLSGADVTLVDAWVEHVAAINRDGLRIDGVPGEHVVSVAAVTATNSLAPFDLAIVTVDANNTAAAAKTVRAVLKPDGFALTLQNGIGNVEALAEQLGRDRVIGGSSMCSAALRGPGHVVQTHQGPTTIGELDGGGSARVTAVRDALDAAGFDTLVADDVMAVIWQKFLLNLAINPLCAATGLRLDRPVACDGRTARPDPRRGDGGCRGQGYPTARPGYSRNGEAPLLDQVLPAVDAAAYRSRPPD